MNSPVIFRQTRNKQSAQNLVFLLALGCVSLVSSAEPAYAVGPDLLAAVVVGAALLLPAPVLTYLGVVLLQKKRKWEASTYTALKWGSLVPSLISYPFAGWIRDLLPNEWFDSAIEIKVLMLMAIPPLAYLAILAFFPKRLNSSPNH